MGPEDFDFDAFYRRAYPVTIAALRQMGFGLEEAADSASEAMIELLTSSKPVMSPAAWVMKVAFRDAARNAQRHKRGREIADLVARREPSLVQQPPPEPFDRVLLDLLGELTPVRRQVLVLDANGFHAFEIAGILGAKESTVRSHRRHARAQFSRLLAARCEEFTGEVDEYLITYLGRGGART